MRHLSRVLIGCGLVAAMVGQPAAQAGGPPPNMLYLPIVMKGEPILFGQQVINAPYLPGLVGAGGNLDRLNEMAVTWFGQVTAAANYVDVRAGYTDSELVLYLTVFDRLLWYDVSPQAADLHNWDGASLYLDLDAAGSAAPDPTSYRFVAQLSDWQGRVGYQTAYRGNGSSWSAQSLSFVTGAGCRWEAGNVGGFNNGQNNRGCGIAFRIPFASLGLPGRPADGALWRLALVSHDRESAGGPPLADVTWPAGLNTGNPSAWARLRFNYPVHTPPPSSPGGTVVIRHGLNGANVPDAGVGGNLGGLCPGDPSYIWNQWGNASFAGDTGVNIQNQADIADWPCFAKHYVTFPLGALPAGKVIRSATLTLHHWGNSGSPTPTSNIHVLTIAGGWADPLTWNNAPAPLENVSVAAVPPVGACNWPCVPRTWNLLYAVANAYALRQASLPLALYSSDDAYHSGKFMTTSDAGDWNAVGRPTLTVEWGNP